jgi:hypothetical protein
MYRAIESEVDGFALLSSFEELKIMMACSLNWFIHGFFWSEAIWLYLECSHVVKVIGDEKFLFVYCCLEEVDGNK